MRELKGISASPGIYIGKSVLFSDDELSIPNYSIQSHEVEMELSRFRAAQSMAERELTDLRDRALAEMGPEHSAIFDSHLLMLNDVDLLEQIEGRLRSTLRNIEFIVYQVEQSLVRKLSESQDQYLSERSADIKDVSRRVLSHLLRRERSSLSKIEGPAVLVARNLLPSEAVLIDRRSIRALALDGGGKTSHTAILARAFHIPAVLGLQEATRHVKDGMTLIVDGDSGIVIAEPDEPTLARYEELRKRSSRSPAPCRPSPSTVSPCPSRPTSRSRTRSARCWPRAWRG